MVERLFPVCFFFLRRAARGAFVSLLLFAGIARGQKCTAGAANLGELRMQMESTKDANVILRAAAIGGPLLIPELRKLSLPKASVETVAGVAQASLAKLGDEVAYAQLASELASKDAVSAIKKLLIVNTEKSVSMIMG